MIDPHSDQLPVGLIAQQVKHFTSTSGPVKVWIFLGLFFATAQAARNNCEDHYHLNCFQPQFN